MSGTATADVFSGDPSKKFDVIFSVDMRQLLASTGMKPARYRAHHGHAPAANARKAPPVDPMAAHRQPAGAGESAAGVAALGHFAVLAKRTARSARLPLPPEEDSQVQVLLRPGLLADVEIMVEKIPDALHVPAQAVFQKNGKTWCTCRGTMAGSSRGKCSCASRANP